MGWHADGYRVSIATDNDFHWTNDMLGRPTPERLFRTRSTTGGMLNRANSVLASTISPRGRVSSGIHWRHKKAVRRFTYRAGRFRSRCGQRAQPSKENSDHGDGCPRCIEGMENFTPGLGFGEVGLSDLDRPRQPTSGPHVHNCSTEDCGRWGGYGFASAARVETRWWCWEHYPHKTPTIAGR